MATSVTTKALAASVKNSGIRHALSLAVTICTTAAEATATDAPTQDAPRASARVPATSTVAAVTIQRA